MEEDLNTEFKREFVNDLNREVIAFANTDGGKIYIGIEDDGSVCGVADIDKVQQVCVSHIKNTVKPDIILFTDFKKAEFDGKAVLEIEVQKGTECPYYIAGKGIRPEGVYVRVGSSSVPATETAILKMIKETDGDSYEDVRSLNQNLTFEETSKYFVQRKVSFGDEQKRTLGIINEANLYTNLGLLLSEQCKHSIKIAVFDGIEKEVFKDRYEFTGSLLKQMTDAYAFIDRYNRTQATFHGLDRIDERDYPEDAVREALLNAIIHREYGLSGSTIINIFEDKMEFISLGGLVKGIEYDDMMLGVSLSRNRNLANVFYRLRLIEAYGTGIFKIKGAYSSCSAKPKFEVTNNAFKITLPNTNIAQKSREVSAVTPVSEDKRVEKVLELFNSSEEISRSDVEKLLNVSYVTAARLLSRMVEQKLISRVGNTRNTRYIKLG